MVEAPLVGNGLGRLQRLEETWFNEEGRYFGVHNEYLLLWGEAGIIPLVLFVLFLGTLLRRGLGRERALPLLGAVGGWAVIVATYGVTTHGVLVQRAVCFIVGLSCAAVAASTSQAATQAIPATRTAHGAGPRPLLHAPARRPEST